MSPMQTVGRMNTSSQPCNCGCSDCRGECCNLECLVRPNFFCGQLLTDRDLKTFVDWISAKSALQRFREGWGIVCGLEATCSHKDKEHNRVYVGEGYAVDCCGRDIVVCETIWYDFQCDTRSDPCCRKQKATAVSASAQTVRTPPTGGAFLGSIPWDQIRAFDLCLVSDEEMTGGQRAMVRGNCAPMDDCQFTRIKETGKLIAKEVIDPFAPASSRDLDTYRQELGKFAQTIEDNSKSPSTLLSFLAGKLHSFCFVEDWLCDALQPQGGAPRDWKELKEKVLPFIIQDFRNHYLLCSCVSCAGNSCDGDAVPLSRVWIWDRKDAACKMCKVVYVESRPPYRRFLTRDCRPTEPGCLDVSRYIWRPTDQVSEELKALGYEIRRHELTMSDSGLVKNEILCIRRNATTVMHFRDDPYGDSRVVAFQVS